MTKIEIYTSNKCGWAIRNYAALLEKGIPFELSAAYDSAGNKREEFLSLTPYAKTPVMRHGDLAIFETLIINEYIDEAFPESALMPDDPRLGVEAKKWMNYCDSQLIPAVATVVRSNSIDDEAGRKMQLAFDYFEREVLNRYESGPYFFGEQFSLVDLCYNTLFDLLPFVDSGVLEENGGLSKRFNEWRDAVWSRPSIKEARKISEKAPPVGGR